MSSFTTLDPVHNNRRIRFPTPPRGRGCGPCLDGRESTLHPQHSSARLSPSPLFLISCHTPTHTPPLSPFQCKELIDLFWDPNTIEWLVHYNLVGANACTGLHPALNEASLADGVTSLRERRFLETIRYIDAHF